MLKKLIDGTCIAVVAITLFIIVYNLLNIQWEEIFFKLAEILSGPPV